MTEVTRASKPAGVGYKRRLKFPSGRRRPANARRFRTWVSKLELCVHREPELAKELNERWAETTGLRLVPEEA